MCRIAKDQSVRSWAHPDFALRFAQLLAQASVQSLLRSQVRALVSFSEGGAVLWAGMAQLCRDTAIAYTWRWARANVRHDRGKRSSQAGYSRGQARALTWEGFGRVVDTCSCTSRYI